MEVGKNIFITIKSVSIFTNQNIRQFLKYSIVGIFNTIISFSVIFFLFNVLSVNYVLANTIGYICGLINSFIWNKKWTFRSNKAYLKEIILYLLVFIVSYFANVFTLIILVEVFLLNKNISFVLSGVIYVIIGFGANKKWTFS